VSWQDLPLAAPELIEMLRSSPLPRLQRE